jgi:Holliday junction resolvase
MIKKYRKGYMGERELVHLLYNKGYMVVRTPRSGRMNLASPDIIAAKGNRLIVIECKSREDAFKIQDDQLKQLQEWQIKAEAEAYIAWKISRRGWYFMRLEDVMKNNGNVNKSLVEICSFGIDAL